MFSVNQTLPSGPAVIWLGWVKSSGRVNVVTWPAGVIRPTAGLPANVRTLLTNHRLPSGPAVMEPPEMPGVGNSVTWPAGVMRPTAPATGSVNQTLPSGPVATAVAPRLPPKLSGGRANSVMVLGTQRSSSAVARGRTRNGFAGRTALRRNSQDIAISS